MVHKKYYELLEDQKKLLSRKNKKSDFYNGVYDRYEYPVLTREHIPLTWRYDLNEETNPYFMERLGINAVMNSGAMEWMDSISGIIQFCWKIPARRRQMFMTCV